MSSDSENQQTEQKADTNAPTPVSREGSAPPPAQPQPNEMQASESPSAGLEGPGAAVPPPDNMDSAQAGASPPILGPSLPSSEPADAAPLPAPDSSAAAAASAASQPQQSQQPQSQQPRSSTDAKTQAGRFSNYGRLGGDFDFDFTFGQNGNDLGRRCYCGQSHPTAVFGIPISGGSYGHQGGSRSFRSSRGIRGLRSLPRRLNSALASGPDQTVIVGGFMAATTGNRRRHQRQEPELPERSEACQQCAVRAMIRHAFPDLPAECPECAEARDEQDDDPCNIQ